MNLSLPPEETASANAYVSNSNSTIPEPLNLLALPPELRLEIYHHLFTATLSYQTPLKPKPPYQSATTTCQPHHSPKPAAYFAKKLYSTALV